jgi:hypothetical protein
MLGIFFCAEDGRFETILMRIFGLTREEVAGCLRRLHNEELHGLYDLLDIRVIKSRRMKWSGHVACRLEVLQNFGWET